ncbi:MAG TPA: glycosyltransferase family 1 protein [Chloroflexi bacterium]|nr:glycosyltransferase family 1 protein [Chloroflexota bacterium]
MEANNRVTILHWYDDVDDLALTVAACLTRLGYAPSIRHFTTEHYDGARFLFTYAPWGRLQRVMTVLDEMSPAERPFWIHWSTEDCPDLRLPKAFVKLIGQALAWTDRLQDARDLQTALKAAPLRWVNRRFHKFRYVGIYDYAIKRGLMGLLLEYSKVYADYYNAAGIPAHYARWGLLDEARTPLSEAERDIDVLWIGTRRTQRRSRLLDKVIGELNALGKRTYVVDGVNHPPVYGKERAALLGRAKITLNLLPTWYDSALAYRWPLVAASRSLLVSEESLPHAPEIRPGEHYVAAPVAALVDTICHYLDHPEQRAPIVERAYAEAMHGHSILDSVRQIMNLAEAHSCAQPGAASSREKRTWGATPAMAPSLAMLLAGAGLFS